MYFLFSFMDNIIEMPFPQRIMIKKKPAFFQ